MRLLFVHGIAQEGRSAETIRDEWLEALCEGFRKIGKPCRKEAVVPYFGDLLFNLAKTENIDDTGGDFTLRGPVAADFPAFMIEYANELASKRFLEPPNIEARDPEDIKRGIQNWPPIIKLARLIDGKFPGFSSFSISLVLKTVHAYLSNPVARVKIDEAVMNVLRSDEPTVVVGHSLGSVVAYNVLAKNRSPDNRIPQVPLFLTVGSPLGIQAVQSRLGNKAASPLQVDSWYNAFDPQDIVALNPLDKLHFTTGNQIRNNPNVRNSSENHHHISQYLNDVYVATEIGARL